MKSCASERTQGEDMDNAKVKQVCEEYALFLRGRWTVNYAKILGRPLVAQRLSDTYTGSSVFHVPSEDLFSHFLFMAEEIPRLLDAGRTEKAMRWLGWLQGALWGQNFETLSEAKMRNAPEGAEYSRDA